MNSDAEYAWNYLRNFTFNCIETPKLKTRRFLMVIFIGLSDVSVSTVKCRSQVCHVYCSVC